MHTRNSTVIVHFRPRISMISTVINVPGINLHNYVYSSKPTVTGYLAEQMHLSN